MAEVSKEDGYSDYMYLYLFKKGDVKNELVYFDIDELRSGVHNFVRRVS